MAKFRGRHFNGTVVLLAVCAASAILGFVLGNNEAIIARANQPLSVQQSDEKVIERYERPDEPFEFGNLGVKNARIGLRQKFSAKAIAGSDGGQVDDWLENLSFTLKNKSDKQITFILLQLQFPETEATGPLMA